MKLTAQAFNALQELLATGQIDATVKKFDSLAKAFAADCVRTPGKVDTDSLSIEQAADQLAHSLVDILSSPLLSVNLSSIRYFLARKQMVSDIFALSASGNSREAVDAVLSVPETGSHHARAEQLCRAFCLLGYHDLTSDDVQTMATLPPPLALAFALTFFNTPYCFSEKDEEVREALWTLIRQLPEDVTIDQMHVPLVQAGMACSYMTRPDKHQIKRQLNSLLRHDMERAIKTGVADKKDKQNARTADTRPHLLIIAEQMSPDHAMFRCYAPSIRSLKDRFKVTMLVGHEAVDERLLSLAHHIHTFRFEKSLLDPVHMARSFKPDIVYWPSVGMGLLSMVTANSRIAPLQIATNGHPATTMSDCVDYMVTVDAAFLDPALFSEKILLRPSAALYIRHSEMPDTIPQITQQPDCVKIAVPAFIKKLNAAFLDACQTIAAHASRPVEFVFFPNRTGPSDLVTRKMLMSILPAKVMPRASYADYMKMLGACDIHLSTFPFGSSNGIVDAAFSGLPMVNLLGREIHGRIDANLVARLGQPDWLTAHTVGDYITATLRLIANDDLRVNIAQRIIASDPATKLLVGPNATTPDFAELVWAAYKNHETLKTSDRRYWTLAELTSIPEEQETKA